MEKINVQLSSMGRIRLEVVELIIDGCNLCIQWFQEQSAFHGWTYESERTFLKQKQNSHRNVQ